MSPVREQYRQGDVLIMAVEGLPTDLAAMSRDQGRVVLAEGEVTGHAHAIVDREAVLYEGDGDDRFLEVASPVTVTHEEHDAIDLPPGVYQVVRQREYTPKPSNRDARWRYVAD